MDTKKIGKGNSFLHVAISGDQPLNQDGIESMNRRVRSLAHEVPFVTAQSGWVFERMLRKMEVE